MDVEPELTLEVPSMMVSWLMGADDEEPEEEVELDSAPAMSEGLGRDEAEAKGDRVEVEEADEMSDDDELEGGSGELVEDDDGVDEDADEEEEDEDWPLFIEDNQKDSCLPSSVTRVTSTLPQ